MANAELHAKVLGDKATIENIGSDAKPKFRVQIL